MLTCLQDMDGLRTLRMCILYGSGMTDVYLAKDSEGGVYIVRVILNMACAVWHEVV